MTDSGGANKHIQTCRRRSGLLTALRPRAGRVMGRLIDRQEIKAQSAGRRRAAECGGISRYVMQYLSLSTIGLHCYC